MFVRIRRDEEGAALIVALGVTFVVLLLSTVVVNQAIHGSVQSASDRRRLTSVNAAEAGLNYYYNYLENTSGDALSTAPVTVKVGTTPNPSQTTITPTFYSSMDAQGNLTPFSGTPSSTNYPAYVKLVSVGTSNGVATRTMQSFIKLTPVYSGVNGALIANSDTTFSNNFTVNGNSGNDGDVYVLSGNFLVPSGLETIKGNLWVPSGTATIGTGLHLYGEIWASGSVSINHPQAQVDSNVKTTSGSVTVSSGTVSGSAWYCMGSAPTNVTGAKTQTCSLGSPPTQTFPQIKYVQSAWTALGYYVKEFTDCAAARDWIEGTSAGTYNSGSGVPAGYTGAVVYINATCPYANSNNATISLGTDLGIVTNGAINLSQQSTWNGVTSTRSLFFMSAYPASGSPSCPTQDITLGNNTNFNSLVQTGVYGPCFVTMSNNNTAFSGQVIGTHLTIGNNFSMTYKPVVIPGANIAHFRQDIAYIRETTS
jgi:Tfp pilus assembly protein PilX